ncbi:MAG: hypothetical protein PHU14_10605, partial [Methylovulum sp.]|nr:hypothetical protein [Methylovulum sp.]
SSPLLLGMLCLAFADSMEFTTRRVDIYEDAIDALLRKWDSSRAISRDDIYKGLNHHLKKRIFTLIAYKTFSENQYLLKEQALADYLVFFLKQLPTTQGQLLDGEVVLKAIEAQHGIFVERAQKIHSFAHLTFQEYFTACAIKGNPNYQQALMQHISDPRWREVFLLTASLLDDADAFFELFSTIIGGLLKEDGKVLTCLHWAADKATSIQLGYSICEIRFFYICLALFLDSDHAHIRDIGLPHTRARAIDLANALASDHTLAYAIDHAFDLAFGLDRDLALALALALDLERIIDHTLDCSLDLEVNSLEISCDYLLHIMRFYTAIFSNLINHHLPENTPFVLKFRQFHHTVIEKISGFGFIPLAEALTQLYQHPAYKIVTSTNWHAFNRQLADTLQIQRNIGQCWNFSPTQRDMLTNYFVAHSLLLDCLKLATVSDREAIKNRLFLPPSV